MKHSAAPGVLAGRWPCLRTPLNQLCLDGLSPNACSSGVSAAGQTRLPPFLFDDVLGRSEQPVLTRIRNPRAAQVSPTVVFQINENRLFAISRLTAVVDRLIQRRWRTEASRRAGFVARQARRLKACSVVALAGPQGASARLQQGGRVAVPPIIYRVAYIQPCWPGAGRTARLAAATSAKPPRELRGSAQRHREDVPALGCMWPAWVGETS